MLRKKIYKWHRMLSLIAAVPMLLWSGSGILHQAGTWAKPALKMDSVPAARIDQSALKIALPDALKRNCVDDMIGLHIVEYNKKLYYQVRIKKDKPNIYLSVDDGQELERGEERYAVSLAFQMLGNDNAQITHREFINKFSEKYRSSAKVLPVYCVMIKDGNHTSLYIDTWNRKVAFADNKQRHAFHTWFGYLHSWKMLDRWKYAKGIALVSYSLIALVAAIIGVYLYLLLPAMGKEKREKNVMNRRKNYHRWIGIVASFSMILFAFSGALHALVDFFPKDNTSAEPWHKALFNQLHMFRFTNAIGKDFRFWLLMIFALVNLLTVLTGLILATRFIVKRRKRTAMSPASQTVFVPTALAAQTI